MSRATDTLSSHPRFLESSRSLLLAGSIGREAGLVTEDRLEWEVEVLGGSSSPGEGGAMGTGEVPRSELLVAVTFFLRRWNSLPPIPRLACSSSPRPRDSRRWPIWGSGGVGEGQGGEKGEQGRAGRGAGEEEAAPHLALKALQPRHHLLVQLGELVD